MPPRQSDLGKFQAGLVSTYGSRVAVTHAPADRYRVVSSGSLAIDYALRRGGLIRGRIHEIVGAPESAKTTLVINAMARAQRQFPGRGIGYVDIEGTFDEEWAELNGLDLTPGRFDHLYADDSETVSDQARGLAKSGLYAMIAVDSIGGMESRKALEKGAAETLPGRNAQIITRMCKHLASLARIHDCTVILVNQLRANIGGMGPDISAGPKEMQHSTTSKIAMSGGPEEPLKLVFEEGRDAEIVCRQFKARVVRLKGGAPGATAEFWVNNRATREFGPAGINAADEYLVVGHRTGAVERDGAGNYTLPGTGKVKGRAAALKMLRDRPELLEAVRERVLAAQLSLTGGSAT